MPSLLADTVWKLRDTGPATYCALKLDSKK